jgi:integrase
MALFRRPDSRYWWVRFTAPNGQQIRESAGTTDRTAAREYEDIRKAQLWRQVKLGEKPRYRWQQAVEKWLMESAGKACVDNQKIHLRWLHPHLYDLHLDEIDRNVVEQLKQHRLKEGAAHSTCNRTLEVLRAILRRATFEWEWLDRPPMIRLLPEPQRRIRWLKRKDAERLLRELPEHLAQLMRFTLATGLRERNVTHLEWSQVDLERQVAWIHADQAKARKPIGVPLNEDAIAVLEREQGKHSDRVFTFQGRPLLKANTKAWRHALVRAGITDFRWHDLRHTWASWHVQNGTPLNVLQELGGWSCYAMVQRYAHLSAEHLAAYANNVVRNRAASSTISVTDKQGERKAGEENTPNRLN